MDASLACCRLFFGGRTFWSLLLYSNCREYFPLLFGLVLHGNHKLLRKNKDFLSKLIKNMSKVIQHKEAPPKF